MKCDLTAIQASLKTLLISSPNFIDQDSKRKIKLIQNEVLQLFENNLFGEIFFATLVNLEIYHSESY